jgi:hypothetical protein
VGTIDGAVLCGFNWKVGAVVGSHWKGKAVMRGVICKLCNILLVMYNISSSSKVSFAR